ncbi:MAG: NAD(P)/FAD-dependent oxidoreductase [Sneathiella sp.]
MNNNGLDKVTDSELRSALEDANIPTLLMVLTQITGNFDNLTGDQLPSRSIDGVSRMPPERQAEIREQAYDVFRDLRDGTRQIAPLPDQATLEKMLSIYVNEPVGAEYVPMFMEDMGFVSAIDTHIKWRQKPKQAALDAFKVIIIGAGISGICAGIHLKRAGIPFVILEKNDNVGGTWYENTYPACGVDTPNHFYSYSFEPNNNWSAYYSKRDELFSYLKHVATKYGILEHVQFNTQVKDAQYNEVEKNWSLSIQRETKQAETVTSKFVISAVGQLNRAKIPNFPGKEDFKGDAFHSAQWRHDVDLRGKRVAVIGTGASAMQLCPEIAKEVSHLTILQRSPHWIRILPDYHKTVSDSKKWLLQHLPFYQNWYRFKLFWSYGDGVWNSLHFDPKWPHKDRSTNAENERHRNIYIKNLSDALDGDEDLLKKVTPDYPPFAKRMLIDNHWCEMLKRDNVSLETAGISKITEDAVIDDQGAAHKVDAIIYATGFHAGELLAPMKIVGRGGRQLREIWGDDARAYLGMTAPDFPNFFMFYGPNTNLAHGGSLIFHVECQARYITKCLMRMLEEGHSEVEVKASVHDHYNEKVDAEHNSMVWSHPKVGNWYKNKNGRVVANSPWRLVDYWTMTYETEMSDFKLTN